jgi:hypothetical protein
MHQVHDNLDGDRYDDDPIKAGRTAGVGEAAEDVGHVRQGLGFVPDFQRALAVSEPTDSAKVTGLSLIGSPQRCFRELPGFYGQAV